MRIPLPAFPCEARETIDGPIEIGVVQLENSALQKPFDRGHLQRRNLRNTDSSLENVGSGNIRGQLHELSLVAGMAVEKDDVADMR